MNAREFASRESGHAIASCQLACLQYLERTVHSDHHNIESVQESDTLCCVKRISHEGVDNYVVADSRDRSHSSIKSSNHAFANGTRHDVASPIRCFLDSYAIRVLAAEIAGWEPWQEFFNE